MAKYIEVDIHDGHPQVKEAMDYLSEVIDQALYNNLDYLKVITGYGSTTGKHFIKSATIKKLNELKSSNYISYYVSGEELTNSFHQMNTKIPPKYLHLLSMKEIQISNEGAIYIFFK